jgi:hypothetical protein
MHSYQGATPQVAYRAKNPTASQSGKGDTSGNPMTLDNQKIKLSKIIFFC